MQDQSKSTEERKKREKVYIRIDGNFARKTHITSKKINSTNDANDMNLNRSYTFKQQTN